MREKSRSAGARNLRPKKERESASAKSSAKERESASAKRKKSACPALMNSYSVDSDEAMKRGNEALNASLLTFLRSIKRFVGTIFYTALNASSLLHFKENHR